MTKNGQSKPVKIQVLGALVLLLLGTEASAEWPILYKPDLSADIFWQKRNIDLQSERLTEDELRTGIEFQQRGYWSDPRIVKFAYSFRPVYSQRKDSPDKETKSRLWNYSIGIDILHGAMTPVEASVHSFMANNDYKATLGGTTESRVRQNSAFLRWKYRPFPLLFSVTEQDQVRRSDSVFAQSIVERDESQRLFRMRGESSKLTLLAEHETRENRVSGFYTDQERDLADLYHRFRWGRNSRLDSRVEYRKRVSVDEFTTSAFTQDIHVQHLDNLNSALHYRFDRASGALDTRTRDARYSLNHQLYSNLASSLLLFGQELEAASLALSDYGAGVSLQYQKAFSGTKVALGGFHRRSWVERISREGFIEVLDESYQAPADGRIVLSDRFIERDSVVITDPSGGTVYVEGLDYELLVFGNGVLIVSLIPGGDLEPGRTFLVSYLAALQPSGQYVETESSFSATVTRGRLVFYHYQLGTRADLEEGFVADQLADRRQVSTSLSYGWSARRADFHLSASTDLWQDRGLEIDSTSYTGSVSYALGQSANASLTLSRQDSLITGLTRLEVGAGEEELATEFTSLRLGLDWKATASLTVRSSVLAWERSYQYRFEPNRSFDENIVGATLDFDYQFRKFSSGLQLFYNDWETQGAVPGTHYFRNDNGFRLRVRRYF